MERLTEKYYHDAGSYMKCSENCNVDMDCVDCPAHDNLVERLAAYEDTGLTPEEIKAAFTEGAAINLAAQVLGMEPNRLRELAEADKDGRVVVLPCKVGDTVHFAAWFGTQPHIVERVDDVYFHARDAKNSTSTADFYLNDIGKTVFLTREEAERAMETRKEADHA